MRNLKWLTAALALVCISVVAQAAQYEFATLSFPDGGIRWVDKAGTRNETSNESTDLFAELSGEDRKLAHSVQHELLLLNGLSRKGWELVQVTGTAGERNYLFKRELAGPVAAGEKPAKTDDAKSDVAKPAAIKADAAKPNAAPAGETKLPLTFTGGHETDPRDHGRPVVLIAAALKVPDEIFRETFTHVTPASGGREPEEAQVRKNKQALMRGLSPYGVTDERLNEVSNFYRYSGSRGQMWRNTPAEGFAVVQNGAVTSVTVTNAGAGYSSAPKVSVAGMDGVRLQATLSYGTEFDKNGSIKDVTVMPEETPKK